MVQEMEGVKQEALAATPWLGVLLMQVRAAWEPLAFQRLLQNLPDFAREEEGMD